MYLSSLTVTLLAFIIAAKLLFPFFSILRAYFFHNSAAVVSVNSSEGKFSTSSYSTSILSSSFLRSILLIERAEGRLLLSFKIGGAIGLTICCACSFKITCLTSAAFSSLGLSCLALAFLILLKCRAAIM